jgi:uncharacterized protein YehS (DUF1456 family)
MINNDIIRRIRYTFDLNDTQMMDIFADGGSQVTRSQICDWLKKEDDDTFIKLKDVELAAFLNGFISARRGKKEGAQPMPESRLNNNIILRKLKIALNLKDEDILSMLEMANMQLSKHELSAFFRNPNQSQYRVCNDQALRNFLHGMQLKLKG